MRTSFFKETEDDWYGNYKIADDARHVDKKYVEVKLLSLGPSHTEFRVCVWGNDDCGMERDFKTLSEAITHFNSLAHLARINKQDLLDLGYDYA